MQRAASAMRNAWTNAVALRSEKSVGCTIERMAAIAMTYRKLILRAIRAGHYRTIKTVRPRAGHAATLASRGPRCGDPVLLDSRFRGNERSALHSRRFEERTGACATRRSCTGIAFSIGLSLD